MGKRRLESNVKVYASARFAFKIAGHCFDMFYLFLHVFACVFYLFLHVLFMFFY